MKTTYLPIILSLCLASGLTASALINKNKPENTWRGYDQEWISADSLIYYELPASALIIVNEIYDHAKSEKDDAQLIRSITYLSNLTIKLNANGEEKAVEIFKSEIKNADTPVKNILQSMLAEAYENFLNQYGYKLYNNKSENISIDDLQSYTAPRLKEMITELYTSSLEDPDELKKIKSEAFKTIFRSGDNEGKLLRPTLYDILAGRAIIYLSNDNSYISDPKYTYATNDSILFADNKSFAAFNFSFEDKLQWKELAVYLMQELTRFHLNDMNPAPLIDLDLTRFRFAKLNNNTTAKDTLYMHALEKELKTYNSNSFSTHISFMIADLYFIKGKSSTRERSQNYNLYNSIAHNYCSEAIKKFPGSAGARDCKKMIEALEHKYVEVLTEKVELPDKPFRMMVEYRNIDSLDIRIIPISQKQKGYYKSKYGTDKITYLTKLPYVKEWKQKLPGSEDFNLHGVEIPMESLNFGAYLILGYDSSDITNPVFSINSIQISNLCIVANETAEYYRNNASDKFFIVNRTSGQPIPNAEIECFSDRYHFLRDFYSYSPKEKYITDANGYFEIKKPKYHYGKSRSFIVHNGSDMLDSDEEFFLHKEYKQKPSSDLKNYLFTDRAIYRPGQTIYFKGILIETSDSINKNHVVENNLLTIAFYNHAGSKVDTLNRVTNEFGSIAGSFEIPTDILSGRAQIVTNYGSITILIEEYKRPTFTIKMEEASSKIFLNENVAVSGSAIAYSGSAISNGIVKYQVERKLVKGGFQNSGNGISAKNISNGEAITDANGKFTISFFTEQDSANKNNKAVVYDYIVSGSITDISGESREFSKTITAGYISTLINFSLPEIIVRNQDFPISVNATNLNNIPISATGKITFAQLETPKRFLRERFWKAPDQWLISEEEYIKKFPNDIYKNENEIVNWKEFPVAKEYFFNTDSKVTDTLSSNDLKPGKYKCTLYFTDRSGEKLTATTYVTVRDEDAEYNNISNYLEIDKQINIAEVGSQLDLKVLGSAEDPYILWDLTKINGSFYWEHPENAGNNFEIHKTVKLEEKNRGGTGFEVWFVKNNRFYKSGKRISVPWSNKELQIELETFRDKLEPGKEESWKIKIKGPQGEKVAAEILASMYDLSLDQFATNTWNFVKLPTYYSESFWNTNTNIKKSESYKSESSTSGYFYPDPVYYNCINWFDTYWWGYFRNNNPVRSSNFYDMADLNPYRGNLNIKGSRSEDGEYAMMSPRYDADYEVVASVSTSLGIVGKMNSSKQRLNDGDDPLWSVDALNYTYNKVSMGDFDINNNIAGFATEKQEFENITARKNLKETAFFLPQLKTDSAGAVVIEFTVPEALTQWKMQIFAHTKDLLRQYSEETVITQKDFMISPYFPRFFREGDIIQVSAKIQNLTDKNFTGVAQLELRDALTLEPLNEKFLNLQKIVDFAVPSKLNTVVYWQLTIPENITSVIYTVKATNGSISDGEENIIPVLTDKILMTESFPLNSKAGETQNFLYSDLLNNFQNPDRSTKKIVMEYTSNPAWYAVQSLPYLQEYPYECAEQLFNRYYSNALASAIVFADPQFEKIYASWEKDSSSLVSNLQKNAELKSILLEETPWVLQAADESSDKQRMAKLFNKPAMQIRLQTTMALLKLHQLPNGGFTWFTGDFFADQYISQYILAGMAHLHGLETPVIVDREFKYMLGRTLNYCNATLLNNYEELINDLQHKTITDTANYRPSATIIQYFYASSYFPDNTLNAKQKIAYSFYLQKMKKFWMEYNLYEKAMIALALNRLGDKTTSDLIARSLKENSIVNAQGGRYWKNNITGYNWSEAMVETQAILIEVFDQILKDNKSIDELKIWLLQQKQTNAWQTTKATAEASYALLFSGNRLADDKQTAQILVANAVLDPTEALAALGYYKKIWSGSDITGNLATISITDRSGIGGYGAMYWQYLDKMENIKGSGTGLQITKRLSVQRSTPQGKISVSLEEGDVLSVGDLVITHLEINVDRDMEYIQLKDLRASCQEPTQVMSGFKWMAGTGYYQTTGDASTNYFFSALPKGKYSLEYSSRITHTGKFSSGVASIQCMYAPEFVSYSSGNKLKVD